MAFYCCSRYVDIYYVIFYALLCFNNNIYFRLGTKSVFGNLAKYRSALGTVSYAQSAAVPKITFKNFEPPKEEHHDIKNERLKRPLSPHLTIIEYQLTSILSISHRFAGGFMNHYIFLI